jgi:16S rRNA (guanine966-N2)-methyltransferase
MIKRTAKAGNKPQQGRLRIVAGKWRSRLLLIADVPGLRPTSERIRETLFNWLAPTIHGARCLDLFAGTGVLGLEALSRGAAEVTFVENSRVAVATLRDNIAALDASAASVREMDARDYLQSAAHGEFDIVFVDPPFAADMHEDLCRLLAEARVLSNSAWIYLEEDRAKPAVAPPKGWQTMKTRNAGNVRYSLVKADTRD